MAYVSFGARMVAKRKEQQPMNKNTTLYDLGDYDTLIFNDEKANSHFEKLKNEKLGTVIPAVEDTHIGIEVEVERCAEYQQITKTSPVWNIVPDGSLRNSGVEFVSIPIRGDNIYKSLSLLRNELQLHCPKFEFSERTSIHVHVNVRPMTLEQLFVFMITYMIVEKPLFHFVEKGGFNREKNIFCTPIMEAKDNLKLQELFILWKSEIYSHWWNNISRRWQKYTSFNTIPVMKQGTIEFRHMGGNLNVPYLMDWINLILSIKKFAKETKIETMFEFISSMNTNSSYGMFLESVFGPFTNLVRSPDDAAKMEQSITLLKEALAQKFHEGDIIPGVEIEQFKKSSTVAFLKTKGLNLDISNLELLLKKQEELARAWRQADQEVKKTKNKEAAARMKSIARELDIIRVKIEQIQQLDVNF